MEAKVTQDRRHDTNGDGRARDPQGRDAERPKEMPAKGWKNVLKGVKTGMKEDKLTLVAAGVAFYGMVAMVPALAALVSIYGIFSDPATIQEQVGNVMKAVPADVSNLVTEQLTRLSSAGRTSLGIGVVVATVVALWSASAGVQALMDGVGISYDEDDERGFVKRRGLALLLTLGAILLAVVVLALIVALPSVMGRLPVGDTFRTLVSALRWPILAILVVLSLGVLYRLGPARSDAKTRWLSPGALVGTALWLIASGLFSLYVSQFGKYNDTYGSLGAVLVLLLWLWISALSVLIGARLNAELERQTAEDTTRGPDEPMGARGAEVADNVAPDRG